MSQSFIEGPRLPDLGAPDSRLAYAGTAQEGHNASGRAREAHLLVALERKLARPADSERRRLQKAVSVLIGMAGGLMALLFAAVYAAHSLPMIAWLYALTTFWTAISIIILLRWPRAYYGIVLSTCLYVTIHPWIVTVASGGLSTGLLAMMWALLGPVVALLLLDRRAALLNAALFACAAMVATFLDARAAVFAITISGSTRLFLSVLNSVVPSLIVILSSLFLFDRLEEALEQTDDLLSNMLPGWVSSRLKHSPASIAEGYDDVTVLFADIVEFTRMSAGVNPCHVVGLLNDVFGEFDRLADRHRLEKIKTIGDAYMVVGGLERDGSDHCRRMIAFALDMLAAVHDRTPAWNGERLALRIGVHRGPVVAGVIGRRKLSFDVWGDTVNVASRMEYCGLPNTIQVTAAVRDRLSDGFQFEPREPFHVKGKGMMATYLLRPVGTLAAEQ